MTERKSLKQPLECQELLVYQYEETDYLFGVQKHCKLQTTN